MTSAKTDSVREFLAQKHIAVAGVSRNPQGKAANAIYKKLKGAHYQVYAINPKADEVEGDPCYRDLKSVTGPIDGVVVVTQPENSKAIAQECVELGIPRVWMHRSFGQGSVSDEGVRLCKENGITVIAGGCPMMFCEPVDLAHKCIRWFLRVSGKLPA